MIDATNIKKVSWILLAIFIFFLAFGPSNLKFFWPAFFIISLAALGWTLHLIYVCEKFTVYILSLVLTTAGVFTLLSCNLAYHAAARLLGDAGIAAFLVGFIPMGITALTYLILVNGKPSFYPFEHDGIKVGPRPQGKQKPSTTYSPLLVAGATTLAASFFTKTVGVLTSGMVALFGLLACSMIILFYARHIIRGLRTLRNQEKTMPTPYTFMHIDEIRKARSQWWMSRLLKWIASWRASPGT
ncbi:hypothetical protein [Pseudomonas putida]|jgi:hypothetical protein|uniref:hypothetical protein n=1 Tax=Pseudomonas putida TaxID=303 RepID=UPI0018CA9C4D|nr:hypothetical protein I5S86_09680 [Priestia aryabhattai]